MMSDSSLLLPSGGIDFHKVHNRMAGDYVYALAYLSSLTALVCLKQHESPDCTFVARTCPYKETNIACGHANFFIYRGIILLVRRMVLEELISAREGRTYIQFFELMGKVQLSIDRKARNEYRAGEIDTRGLENTEKRIGELALGKVQRLKNRLSEILYTQTTAQ